MQCVDHKEPKANKEHRCQYCSGSIERGDRYCRAFMVDGRDVWTWKSHRFCNSLANMFMRRDSDWFDGMDSEGFWECLYAWQYRLAKELTASVAEAKILAEAMKKVSQCAV